MNKFEKCEVAMLETKDNEYPVLYNPAIKKMGLGISLYKRDGYDVRSGYNPHHLYILSNDEIEIGDWVMIENNRPKRIGKVSKVMLDGHYKTMIVTDIAKGYPFNYCDGKKIIASTDKLLDLASPSDSFMKKFCEVGGIWEVLVEYEEIYKPAIYMANNGRTIAPYYKEVLEGVKPKVNPKDNTITIKRVKASWDKEEVETLLKRLNFFYEDYYNKCNSLIPKEVLQKWIEDNL